MTVREATFDVLRRLGMTRIFGNPGSTEVPFLAGLPDDLRFVLALHEGSVVGLATGYALGRGEPALALLHTTAGLGNAVGAIATARVNRAPLVVVVGQQDRRQLAFAPFLTGHDLEQLCLSPQCGFSSTVEGNQLSEEEQWAKLRLIVEVAEEVWGET